MELGRELVCAEQTLDILDPILVFIPADDSCLGKVTTSQVRGNKI